MKKIIVIILVTFYLLDTGGCFFIFKLLQWDIYFEIMELIENERNEKNMTIVFENLNKPSQILWIRKGKEFIYKGDMFDVVKKIREGNKIKYYCFKDEKEKRLLSEFHKTQANHKNKERIIKRIFNYYLPIKQNYFQIFLSNKVNFLFTTVFYFIEKPDIPSPPPKLI